MGLLVVRGVEEGGQGVETIQFGEEVAATAAAALAPVTTATTVAALPAVRPVRLGPDAPRVERRAQPQQAIRPFPALTAEVAQPPEPAHGEDERTGVLLRTGDDRAVQGRPDVVELGLQTVDPGQLRGGAQQRLGLLDEVTHPRAVAPLGRGAQLGDFGGALGGVLVDRLQHAVPHAAATVLVVRDGRGRDDQ